MNKKPTAGRSQPTRGNQPEAGARKTAQRSSLEGRQGRFPETSATKVGRTAGPSEGRDVSRTKFLQTLHDVAAGRALSVAERTPHDYGITAGMSVMLGLIENRASESDPLFLTGLPLRFREKPSRLRIRNIT
jgi:hypothetical protein